MMNKRDQLKELYQRREQSQQDNQRRNEQNKRLDDTIAQLERDLGIEPEKPNLRERLNKRIRGE